MRLRQGSFENGWCILQTRLRSWKSMQSHVSTRIRGCWALRPLPLHSGLPNVYGTIFSFCKDWVCCEAVKENLSPISFKSASVADIWRLKPAWWSELLGIWWVMYAFWARVTFHIQAFYGVTPPHATGESHWCVAHITGRLQLSNRTCGWSVLIPVLACVYGAIFLFFLFFEKPKSVCMRAQSRL